jgi:hypothetical protein
MLDVIHEIEVMQNEPELMIDLQEIDSTGGPFNPYL